MMIAGNGAVVTLRQLGTGSDELRRVDEAAIQRLVADHPACLPIRDIDPLFDGAITVCTELNTPAGPIDILLITPSGLPVIVECKLWRNPESRREVVGQIIDYAKELSRWTCSDLQREINRRRGTTGNELLRLVREVAPATDEIAFNDDVSLNLRRGRFLLLLVGDGIRQGVEAIAEYVQRHAGLHFTLGLVELPLFECPDGALLVAPRVVARTESITRTVIAAPDGFMVADVESTGAAGDQEDLDPGTADRLRFWGDFLAALNLDDPDQPVPRAPRQGYIAFTLPGSTWLLVYRDLKKEEVGLYLSSTRETIGLRAVQRAIEDWPPLRVQLGGGKNLYNDPARSRVGDWLTVGSLGIPENRGRAIAWLALRTNDFVNVLRPLVRAAVADLREETT